MRAAKLRTKDYPDLPRLPGKSKPSADGDARTPVSVAASAPTVVLPEDSMAAYSAGVFDTCGDFAAKVNVNMGLERITIRAKMTTQQEAVLAVIKARYGGEITKIGENGSIGYTLTWPDRMALHGFLSAIAPYSARWRDRITPVLSYLEQHVLLKMLEAELLKSLEEA
jgi:hypothetical protein